MTDKGRAELMLDEGVRGKMSEAELGVVSMLGFLPQRTAWRRYAMTEQQSTRETWKPAVGYPLYEVSDLGRVRSLPSAYVRREWRHQHQQIVHVGGNVFTGYTVKRRTGAPVAMKVTVTDEDGRRWQVRVHRLVLEAFVGRCPDGLEGCHNDGNPENNRLDNLRWDTHASNVRDSIRHGTKTDPPTHSGETHPLAKLTRHDVAAIRSLPRRAPKGTWTNLSRLLGVSLNTVCRVRDSKQRITDEGAAA